MKKAVKTLSFVDVIFLILLMVSGSFIGIMSDILYFVAFLIPFVVGFYYSRTLKREREEERGLYESVDSYFSLDTKRLIDLLPLIAPAVAVIFSLAAVTSLLLNSLGFTNPQPQNEGILIMLVVHALYPAVLEEMLFRYIPMKLIAPYSRRWCVIFSSLFFALIHANLFQIPYAFAAGAIFMCINLAFESVLPSLILHFLNNAASVVWMKYCTDMTSVWIFVSILLLLTVISLVFIVLWRTRYKEHLISSLEKGMPEFDSRGPVTLIVISLYIALTSLFR